MKTLLVNANSQKIPLADKSVHMVACSPPYWALRDYKTGRWVGGDPDCDHITVMASSPKNPGAGMPLAERSVCKRCGAVREDAQIGLEPLHDCLAWARGEEPCGGCFVCSLRTVARELWRVLRDDGTWWLNLGDSYASGEIGRHDSGREINGKPVTAKFAGNRQARRKTHSLKPKDMAGIPWRVALALQADGWYLRNDIIWHKPNPLPESVADRCTKAHEYIFLLTKSPRYYYDNHAIREPLAVGTFERTLRGVGGDHKWTDGAPGSTKHSLSQARANRKHTDGSTGGGGSHLQGHSGYYKANGEPLAHPDGRNKRTVWEVSTQSYPGSHFATWPEALVDPMIKAGTSEHGVCPKCGAPWQRVVDKGEAIQRWDNPNPVRPYEASSEVTGGAQGENGSTLHMVRPLSTTGWEPGCNCGGLVPVPAVVLDPFAGSGTTGVVSRRLNRNFIGLDLSFEYLQNEARSRLALDVLAAWGEGRGQPAKPKPKQKRKTVSGQMPLIEEID